MIEHLNFLNTVVRLEVEDEALSALAPTRRFFRHLLHAEAAGTPTFQVAVAPYRGVPGLGDGRAGEHRVIRRSTASQFNFEAEVIERGNRRLYVNDTTSLDVPLDARTDPHFQVGITPGSTFQVIDFIRDLVIRNEESEGTVVLHAAGATDGDSAVLMAGPKGSGKTTALLSLLQRPGWRYFTGDKVFCRLNGGAVDVYPWRDYPYVGVGTIQAHPRLAGWVRRELDPGVDRRDAAEKLLIDPDRYESWLGSPFSAAPKQLRAILLPEVHPGRPLRVTELSSGNERWARLNTIVDRQADTTFFAWQSYLVPDYTRFFASLAELHRRLDGVPMIRLSGTLDVDPALVLAHV